MRRLAGRFILLPAVIRKLLSWCSCSFISTELKSIGVMESTEVNEVQEQETPNNTEDIKKGSRWCHSKRFRFVAVFIGFSVSAVVVLALYFAGTFNNAPELPDRMEGEASFTTESGEQEIYHIQVDYSRNIVQLTQIDSLYSSDGSEHFGRRTLSVHENKTGNVTINATKIVIQDYAMKRKYFIIPNKDENSTTKCIFSSLDGNTIPKDLLKHATLKTENVEGNATHSHFKVDNDTDVDVYRTRGRHGKIFEVYINVPNGSLHMRSKEEALNFTSFETLECFRYIEENDTIEESFFESNSSKFYSDSAISSNYSADYSVNRPQNASETSVNASVEISSTESTPVSHGEVSDDVTHVRRRRSIGIRNGKLDWWYANWCGPYQGGYEEYPKQKCQKLCLKSVRYITPACRNCLQPKNGFDSACMEHDRCLMEAGRGPRWCHPMGNRCSCDFEFVWRAAWQTIACRDWDCRWHALQAKVAFHFLSCWFPFRICFPWIRFSCGCKYCTCPRISIYWKCFTFKMCAPFGSGKVWW